MTGRVARTHLLTPYSKNSVTRAVEPLRVMAWFVRVACFWAMMGEGQEEEYEKPFD